jgi:predicted dehydrogenase
MLKIALLSKWHVHAEEYARKVAAMDSVKISAVWDEDVSRGARWAEEYSADFVPDLDALLKRADVDAVIVTSSTATHEDLILKAAGAKKHIFVEKVLAPTLAECRRIARAVEKAGVRFSIAYAYLCMPEYLYAKQLVMDGALGRLTALRSRSAHNFAENGFLPDAFFDPKQAVGGAMLDLGSHPMYLAAWLLGKPISVVSQFKNNIGRPLEDNAISVIEFEDGVLYISETSFVSMPPVRFLEISGTKGTLRIEAPMLPWSSLPVDVKLYVDDQKKVSGWITPEKLPPSRPDAITMWVKAIQEDTPVCEDYDMSSAIRLTKLMEGAYLAQAENRKVMYSEFD